MTGMGERGKQSLDAIDLLRFASASGVLAYHYGSAFGRLPDMHAAAWPPLAPLPASWMAVTWCGWIGVELFFVISGCVIAGSARGATAGAFLRKRAARLFPAAWICASLTLAALLLAGASGPLFREWLGAVTLWPTGPWIDGVYWTLGVEIAFYALVALLLVCGAGERMEGLGLALAGASLAYSLSIGAGLLPPGRVAPRVADLLLLTHGCFFALGIFVRAVLDHGMTRARAAAIGLCLLPATIEIAAHALASARQLGIAATPLMPMALFVAGLGLMLAARRLQPLLARRLPAGLALSLGLATYPLYLLHQEAGAAALSLLARAGVPGTVSAPALGVGMILLSVAIAGTAEPWLRRRLNLSASGPDRASAHSRQDRRRSADEPCRESPAPVHPA